MIDFVCAILFTDCSFPFEHLQHSLYISHRLSHLLVDFRQLIYLLIIYRWSFVDYFPGTNYSLIKFNRNGNRQWIIATHNKCLFSTAQPEKEYTQNNSRWRFSEWQLDPAHFCSTWITEMALPPFNGMFEFFHCSFISMETSDLNDSSCSYAGSFQNVSEFNRTSAHTFVLFWIPCDGTTTRNAHQILVKSVFSQYFYDKK